jgi:hypothetical protein
MRAQKSHNLAALRKNSQPFAAERCSHRMEALALDALSMLTEQIGP